MFFLTDRFITHLIYRLGRCLLGHLDKYTEEGRAEDIISAGWTPIIIWGDELDDEEKVVSKINDGLSASAL